MNISVVLYDSTMNQIIREWRFDELSDAQEKLTELELRYPGRVILWS